MCKWTFPDSLRQQKPTSLIRQVDTDWPSLMAGFMLAQNKNTASSSPPKNQLVFAWFVYICSGSVSCIVNGEKHNMSTGSFIQVLPENNHQTIQKSADYCAVYIRLNEHDYRKAKDLGLIQDFVYAHGQLNRHIVQSYITFIDMLESCIMNPQTPWPLASALGTLNTVYHTFSIQQKLGCKDMWLSKALKMLHSHLAEHIQPAEVAQHIGIPYETFRKRFSQNMGCSPREYRIQARIDMACNLLQTGKPVGEVAEELGYCDAFLFSKQFKKRTGYSPRSWKQFVCTHGL